MIVKTNLADEAVARLSNRSREFPDTAAVVEGNVNGIQEVEDAAHVQENILYNIDDAEGIQLDRIGDIIGQSRLGANDADYRVYLHARVLANVSQGTREELIAIANALWPTNTEIVITEEEFLTSKIDVDMTMTDTREIIHKKFNILDAARPAGYRFLLHYRKDSEANTAKFGVAGEFGKKFSMSIDRSRV